MFFLDSLPVAVILIVVPLAVFGYRLGWHSSSRFQWFCFFLACASILLASPWGQGLDLLTIKYINGWLCGAVAGLLIWKRSGWFERRGGQRFYVSALILIALLSVCNYVNYFAFHGAKTFVQLHDVAHYYLGSKYFTELGYGDLYTAMLRADLEAGSDLWIVEARDLSTNTILSVTEHLHRGDEIRKRFSPLRWARFLADVEYFRERLGPSGYTRLLLDHGYNATPFWTVVGRNLGEHIDVIDDRSALLLALIDPLLILFLLFAIGRTFGLEVAALCVTFFAVIFGATFGWTGGAFLRLDWFFCSGLALCALHRQRTGLAGSLVAVAALLRVFPIAFAAGPAVLAGYDIFRKKAIGKELWRYVLALLVTGLIGLVVTSWAAGGVGQWTDFQANTGLHLENISPNLVSVVQVLAYRGGDGTQKVTLEEFKALKERRLKIRRAVLWLLLPMTFIFFLYRARTMSILDVSVLGIVPVFVALDLAGYYYVMLVFLLLAFHRQPRAWILMFSIEALLYSLVVFEEQLAVQFLYRCVMVGWLLLLLYVPSPPKRDSPEGVAPAV